MRTSFAIAAVLALTASARNGRKLNIDDGSGDNDWSEIQSGRGFTGNSLLPNPNRGMANNIMNGSSTGASDSEVHNPARDTALDSDMGRFVEWASGNNRQYGDRRSFNSRFNKWRETDRHITEVNAQADPNDPMALRLGHNRFSAGELPMTGRKSLPESSTGGRGSRNAGGRHNTDITVAYNWVTAGKVSPIKDQGNCGSCYAFSGNTTLEGRIAVAENKDPVHLSEQEITECSNSYGNGGCNGGLEIFNWSYQRDNGARASADYPYLAGNGSSFVTECKKDQYQPVARVDSFVQGSNPYEIIQQLEFGPVTIGIRGENASFYSYQSGILTTADCPNHSIDHGVTVVGYVPVSSSDDSTDDSTDNTDDSTDGNDDSTDNTDDTTDDTTDPNDGDITDGDDEDQTETIVVTTCELRRWGDRQSTTGCRYEDWYPQADNRRYCCYDEEVTNTVTSGRQSTKKNVDQAYFIVANSWGTGWGIDGYVYMAFEPDSTTGACGINKEPFWVTGHSE